MTSSQDSKNLLFVIETLFSMREKWAFYLSGEQALSSSEISKLGDNLEQAAKLWLLDYYFSYHDHHNRVYIKARAVQKKYPATASRDEVKAEVTRLLSTALQMLESLPDTSEYIMPKLQIQRISEAADLCGRYFDNPTPFLDSTNLDQEAVNLKLSNLFMEQVMFT